jgi:peptidoglycan/xylan/chitin deacetylase (PgdA/CDA1 family)
MRELRNQHWILVLLLCSAPAIAQHRASGYQYLHGAIVRGDSSAKELALVFTGDAYAEGGLHIARVLERQGIKASFFFTGTFYRNPEFKAILEALIQDKHYLGAHSDQHLLYCSWENRDSLLVSQEEFRQDLLNNYASMLPLGIGKKDAPYYLPPYEWYNDSIASWTRSLDLQLVNYTFGTLSHADYTLPATREYRSSREILDSILEHEARDPHGLNGFILLSHVGTEETRTDKFYLYLEELIIQLKHLGYRFKRIDELL